ncbi:right-handed parallel beta-helix repeat-containing protein [Treponema denticola]|uniref:right-handed parallel beta-helix repeat-containing protein n=1 Tax=Treponema denticola TaxID=158 RepID=UPI003D070431
MKKLLKILTTIAAVLAAALFFAGCKQFLEDPEEFLGYWSSEVVPIDFSINKPYQMSNDGALCIPSADDVKLTIKLRNPRKFTLIMPTSVFDAGKVINFPGFPSDQQPRYNIHYTFKQTGDMLELTYKEAFLKAHEWSNGGIGPEITLISTDGRIFSRKFSLNIEANTPPPEIGDIKIAKTEGFYALCFDETVGMTPILNGKRLHKDIKAIHIQKEGGSEVTIPLTVKEDGSGFYIPSTLPEGLLSSVDTIFDTPPGPGSWTVYIKTYTELAADGALPQKYKVWLTDKKGLSSALKEAETLGSIPDISDNTKAWKNLKKAVEKASENGVIIVTGNVKATNDPGNSGAIRVKRKITIRKAGSTACELNANKTGLSTNAHRIFIVENKGELTLENLTLTDGKAEGDSYGIREGGGILVKKGGKAKLTNCSIKKCEVYGFGGGIYSEGELILDKATIGGSAADGNKAKMGGGIYLRGKNASGTMENNSIVSYNEASDIGDVSKGGGICIAVGAHFTMKEGTISYNKSTENPGKTAYGGGVCVVGNKPLPTDHASFTLQYGTIDHNTAAYGGGVATSDGGVFTMAGGNINDNEAKSCGGGVSVHGAMTMTGGTISQNRCTTLDPTHGGGGIFLWLSFGGQVTLNMSGGTIKNNTSTSLGAGVLVKHDYRVKMQMSGDAQIDVNNDVYLGLSSKIYLSDALTTSGKAALITPDVYDPSVQVLDGSIIAGTPPNYKKFEVTPKGGTPWYVGSDGLLTTTQP